MVIAFASFLAARVGASPIPALVAVLVGNLGGAAAKYALGRHYGSGWIHRRLGFHEEPAAEQRVRDWYARYGIALLFVSRFLPGVRAIVPPLAGALRVPAVGAITAMGVASGIWYSVLTLVAFRAGSNWDQLRGTVGRYGRAATLAAVAVVAVALGIWLVRRQRRQRV